MTRRSLILIVVVVSGATLPVLAMLALHDTIEGKPIALAIAGTLCFLGPFGVTLLFANRTDAASFSLEDSTERLDSSREAIAPLLSGALQHLLTEVRRIVGDTADSGVFRACFHRVIGDEYEQETPYVGLSATRPMPSRRWSTQVGTVGMAVRQREERKSPKVLVQMSESVDTVEKYVSELVRSFGYTREQAERITPMRLSSLAIAVGIGEDVLVLYCDSSSSTFFTQEVLDECFAIARLVATAPLDLDDVSDAAIDNSQPVDDDVG